MNTQPNAPHLMKRLSDLTPDEKRIIVAEFDGWTGVTPWNNTYGEGIDGVPPNHSKTEILERCELFDYPNDQNAIIAACGKLDEGQQRDFAAVLQGLLVKSIRHVTSTERNLSDLFNMMNATASQRTDALILTIGKATL